MASARGVSARGLAEGPLSVMGLSEGNPNPVLGFRVSLGGNFGNFLVSIYGSYRGTYSYILFRAPKL